MIDMTKSHTRPIAMSWVPVRDQRGRIHMEARWFVQRPAEHRRSA